MSGEIVAQDATGAPFNVGSVVTVRCSVSSWSEGSIFYSWP